MSHFSDIRTQLTNPAALISGLKAMGFEVQSAPITPGMTATQLRSAAIDYDNSYSDTRHAHVIARHARLKNKRTAIGFLWNPDSGVYTLQCDAYEVKHSQYGQEFGYTGLRDDAIETLLNQKIQQAHDRAGVLLKYPTNQFQVIEEQIDNRITLTIKPKRQLQTIGGNINNAI